MSLFILPVGDLLSSYDGDSKTLSFDGEVYDGFYSDLKFLSPLVLSVRLIGIDVGITLIIEKLEATVEFEGISREILIENVERTFKKVLVATDPDDIKLVDTKHSNIDLKEVIREEILIQCID